MGQRTLFSILLAALVGGLAHGDELPRARFGVPQALEDEVTLAPPLATPWRTPGTIRIQVVQEPVAPSPSGPAATPNPPVVKSAERRPPPSLPPTPPPPPALDVAANPIRHAAPATAVAWPAAQAAPGRMWAIAEDLLWWVGGSRLPPLVTVSPPGTSLAAAGVLGTSGTRTVIGDDHVNADLREGGQLTLGWWCDACRTWGIQADFFVLAGQRYHDPYGSNGSQIVARPFIDATTGEGAAELVSFPGVLAGTATVDARSDPLYSAGLLLRRNLWRGDCCETSLLAGYRYLRFDEDLQVQENLTSLLPATLGTNLIVTDRFSTKNQFQGGELGLQTACRYGSLSLELLAKFAVGSLHRQVIIDGSTEVTVPGFAPVAAPGGLLALASNIGSYSSDRVVVLPQLGLTTGWQLTDRLRATLGYTVLWCPGVVRPGDQIDLAVNQTLLPLPALIGVARPTFTLHESTLVIQGIRLGLEYRY
jgi:hypothetical protein